MRAALLRLSSTMPSIAIRLLTTQTLLRMIFASTISLLAASAASIRYGNQEAQPPLLTLIPTIQWAERWFSGSVLRPQEYGVLLIKHHARTICPVALPLRHIPRATLLVTPT